MPKRDVLNVINILTETGLPLGSPTEDVSEVPSIIHLYIKQFSDTLEFFPTAEIFYLYLRALENSSDRAYFVAVVKKLLNGAYRVSEEEIFCKTSAEVYARYIHHAAKEKKS